jgi:hypothetical protein
MPLVGFYYLWIHFIIMSHRFEFIHRRLWFDIQLVLVKTVEGPHRFHGGDGGKNPRREWLRRPKQEAGRLL